MHIEDRGLILDATKEPPTRRIAFFPGLCVTRSAGIFCAFQSGPVKNAPTSTIRLRRSLDGGATWQEVPTQFETRLDGRPGSLSAAELIEVEPGRLLLFATWFDRTDPDRPLFDPQTEGILRSRQLLTVSPDGGESWSTWQELQTPGLSGCASTGPVLQWNDGTIGYAFESFKEFDDPRPARHAAWLMLSHDGGRTFDEPVQVATDPENAKYYWDQRLDCPGQGREFVAMFWTHDRRQQRDLAVHMVWGNANHSEQVAADPPYSTPISGQIAAPACLGDGRLLAFVVDRRRPGTLTLWTSSDRGKTWPPHDALEIYRHDERALLTQGLTNVDFAAYWEDMGKWSFGHPVLRRLNEKTALLAYYAGTPDCMSLHWSRVAL